MKTHSNANNNSHTIQIVSAKAEGRKQSSLEKPPLITHNVSEGHPTMPPDDDENI